MFIDFLNGIWSGIPLCCISFFIKKSKEYELTSYSVDEERRGGRAIDGEHGYKPLKPHIKYVQCDKCFKNDDKGKKLRKGGILFSLKPLNVRVWK